MKNLILLFMMLLPFAGSIYAQEDCDCEVLPTDEPVCVLVEGEFAIPLPNECLALCFGFSAEDIVECDFDTNPFPQDTTWTECECEIGEEEPICVLTDTITGAICPFPNLCFAECYGYTESDVVECGDFGWSVDSTDIEIPDWECDCELGDETEFVCIAVEDGFTIPYPSLCFAECDGFTADDVVECDDFGWPVDSTDIEIPDWECDCEFGDETEFICIAVEDGFIIPYPSLCFAECDGFTADDVVECDDFGWPVDSTDIEIPDWECDCEFGDETEFVCIAVEDGFTIPYPSLCFAECDGFTADDVVECDDFGWPVDSTIINLDCDCEILPEDTPVCVELEEGFTLSLPNACFAECLELEVVDCEEGVVPGSHQAENLVKIENDDEIESTGMLQAPAGSLSLKNVYPNPVTTGQLNLDIDVLNNIEQDVEISITNIYGATISNGKYVLQEGMNKIAIDVNKVDNGILFVNIIYKDGVTSRKLVKH